VLEFNKDVPEIEKHVQSFPLYIKSYTDVKYNLFKKEEGKLKNINIVKNCLESKN